MLEPTFLTIIDQQGRQTTIPSGELIDSRTGQSSARSVLAIDRRTGKQAWVSVPELLKVPPRTSRYLPATRTEITIPNPPIR